MESFLKWAGGKRWLLSAHSDLLPNANEINKYIEPFLGGGSVFFHLKPSEAILSDLNEELINTYQIIKDNWEQLYDILIDYHKKHCSKFYYSIRESLPKTSIDRAARFIYLNRTCWNGLYRVNKKGQFNVPIGTKTNVILQNDNFEKISKLLQNVEMEVCDFELSIEKAVENDFVFIDPPYTVKHNLNGFVKYNENIFSWQDQIRLKKSVVRAIDRGVNVLVTNANHASVVELYNGCGELLFLDRSSVIAGKAEARGRYSELVLKNW